MIGKIFIIMAWDGKLISQLTDFNFRVTAIDRVDEAILKWYIFLLPEQNRLTVMLFRVGL